MNFQDYISNSTPTDLHERKLHESTDKPKRKFSPKITLDLLSSAMKVFDTLNGHMYSVEPLAMKQKGAIVYFVWYDEDEDAYYINDFTIRDGVGQPVEHDIKTLADAKKSLSRM